MEKINNKIIEWLNKNNITYKDFEIMEMIENTKQKTYWLMVKINKEYGDAICEMLTIKI